MHETVLTLAILLTQNAFGESLQEPDSPSDVADRSNPKLEVTENASTDEPIDYLALVTKKVIEDDGAKMAEELIDTGYSPDTAKQITNELAADIGACILDAVSTQAATKSLAVDWYLRFFAVGSGDPDTAAKLEALDVEAVAAKWNPCINDARTARGLEPRA